MAPRGPVRPVFAVALFALISTSVPQPTVASVSQPAAQAPAQKRAWAAGAPDLLDPAGLVQRFRDPEAKVEITPPDGWQLSPATSLDRQGDDDLFEVARFQLRIGDAALYGQPVPVTSGLLADAGAVLSIALAREGSDLLAIDLDTIERESRVQLPNATAFDTESSYEGVVTFTRTLVARGNGRIVVIRAFVPAAERDLIAPAVLAAIASARAERDGPFGPAYVPPPPPPPPAPTPEPVAAPAQPTPEPATGVRAQIIARARSMLGTPYVWGGNVAGVGMDCSAYVSRAWGVARYTTDSIWNVAVGITKEQLLPGDALNLETWRDAGRRGHIRLFDAWANAEKTLVWVYEETPPRAIHRVIAYDPSYRPIRLSWLGGGGVAPLVPAPAAQPVPRLTPSPTRRPTATARPAATPRPTARPTATPRATPRPTATVRPTPRPSATARPTATVRPATTTPQPTATVRAVTATPRPSPTPTVRAATTTASPTRSASTPRPTPRPKGR